MIEFKQHLCEVELWLGDGDLPMSPEEILTLVDTEEKQFLTDFATDGGAFLSPQQEEEIMRWQWSTMGQEIEQRLMNELGSLFEKMKKTDLTGHDLRHTLLSTWEVMEELYILGQDDHWQKWAIVAELAHDWGHVVEVKLRQLYAREKREFDWGNDLHGRLSFVILKKFLGGFPDIPEKLRELILYAVLVHSGSKDEHDMPGEITALVQSGDRSQLVGGENFYRLLQSEVNEWDYSLVMELHDEEKVEMAAPSRWRRLSFQNAVEFYWRKVNLNSVDESIKKRSMELKKPTGRFLLNLLSQNETEQVFYPEKEVYDRQKMSVAAYPAEGKKLISEELWSACKKPLTEAEKSEILVWQDRGWEKLVDEVWAAPGSSNTVVEIERFKQRMSELSEELRARYVTAMVLYMDFRKNEDQRRKEVQEKWQENGVAANVILVKFLELATRYL